MVIRILNNPVITLITPKPLLKLQQGMTLNNVCLVSELIKNCTTVKTIAMMINTLTRSKFSCLKSNVVSTVSTVAITSDLRKYKTRPTGLVSPPFVLLLLIEIDNPASPNTMSA